MNISNNAEIISSTNIFFAMFIFCSLRYLREGKYKIVHWLFPIKSNLVPVTLKLKVRPVNIVIEVLATAISVLDHDRF